MTTAPAKIRLHRSEARNLLRITEVDETASRLPTVHELGIGTTALGVAKWIWWLLLALLCVVGLPLLVRTLWQEDGELRWFWNPWFVAAAVIIGAVVLLLVLGSIRTTQESRAVRRGLAQLGQARHEIGEVVFARTNPDLRQLFDTRFLLVVRVAGHDHRIARVVRSGHVSPSALPEVGDRVDVWLLPNGPVIVQAPRAVPRQPLGRTVADRSASEVQQAAAQSQSHVRQHPRDRIRLVAPPESIDRLARTWAEWGHSSGRGWAGTLLLTLLVFIVVGLPLAVGIPTAAWMEPVAAADETWEDVWFWNAMWIAFPWFFLLPVLIILLAPTVRGGGRTALHRVYPSEPNTLPSFTGWLVRVESRLDTDDGTVSISRMRVLADDDRLIEFTKIEKPSALQSARMPVIGGAVRMWQLSDGRILAQTALREPGA